jgi:predicted metal-dependent RNase
VKGFSQGRDRNQMRRYVKRYNTYPLVVVTDHKPTIAFAEKEGIERWSYRELEKQWKRLIDEWA